MGFLITTSRASYEMAQKTATAGVRMLVAVSAPTALAVRLARDANLTLVGFARENTTGCLYASGTSDMNIEHLVSMANDIGNFFDGEFGTTESPKNIALHISRYWDPRMRSQIITHVAEGGEGLSPTALAAIKTLPTAAGALMNRRELLGSVGVASLLPALDVFAAVPSARGMPAFEVVLKMGATQAGTGNHRWASILGGDIAGRLLRGRVRSGRMDWHVDPATGAVEVSTQLEVLRADGVSMQLRDRTVHADASELVELPGLCTAPELFDAAGQPMLVPASLAGRLDSTGMANGVVRLRACSRC